MRRTSRRIRRNSRRRTSLRRNPSAFDFAKHFNAMRREAQRIAGSIDDDLRDFEATDDDKYLFRAEKAFRQLRSLESKSGLFHETVEGDNRELAKQLDAAMFSPKAMARR